MKYLIKQAGTEQASYEFKGKHVYRTTTSTQPFDGAKQPNPEEKFFTKRERVKDFAEQEAIKRRFKTQDMLGFKKAAAKKCKKKGKKKMKYMTKKAAPISNMTTKVMGHLRKAEAAADFPKLRKTLFEAEKAGNKATQAQFNQYAFGKTQFHNIKNPEREIVKAKKALQELTLQGGLKA
ncbi:MAG: hypothetical protein H8D23_17715 [Candidatus Brocadiales bacterium]|nr:hypothetical protein [Candidatus Brocadiales bacterium]